jgi:dehydrogenase/reductase SDR family member 7B
VVLITGASSGLGEALAHVFYVAGCKIILAARRQEELERVKKDLLEMHSTSVTHIPVILPLDLSDLNAIPDKVKHVLSIFSHIDILVNNGEVTSRN